MDDGKGCEQLQPPAYNGTINVGRRPEVTPVPEFHEARVRKVANGFILKIGCKEFVAINWEEASTGLAQYWKDPIAAQMKYAK